jgi:glyoxylase-like metal-dependent hydrolase (beta-lactamase superfamily II)
MTDPTPRFSKAISRRAVIGRLGLLTGALVSWHFNRGLVAQTTPAADFLEQMRKTMGAIPPVTSKLTDLLYLISGPGGNIAVLNSPDGKLAVDSGIAGASSAILGQIDSYGAGPLRVLINTHWHFDHTDGNEAFGKKGALIIAHDNVRKRMGAEQDIDFFHIRVPAAPAGALPANTFSSSTTLNLGGEQTIVTHVDPAHTDSDSFIKFVNANVIHGGDLLFSASFPFIDYSTGGRIEGMVAAADRILPLTDSSTKIIPGHGPVMNAAAVREYRDMLADIAARVSALHNQGKDLNATIAAKPTAKYDEKWGKGMLNGDSFTRVAFNSI